MEAKGGKGEKRRMIAITGAAALAAVGLNFLISSIRAHRDKEDRSNSNKSKKDLTWSSVRVNLSASEIHKLADHIIAKSKETYDLVASIPLGKVTYMNVISPLADLEAYQFPLVQSCLFPKMVSPLDDVRKASADAEQRLDSHFLMCRKREDVYRVVKAFVERGERLGPEATRYVQCLVKDFERNGVNLTLSKRIEMENLRSQIDKLSLQYVQNLNEDASFVLVSEPELAGMPPHFIESLTKTKSAERKVFLRSHHVSPILEHCKTGYIRKSIATSYAQRCGKENLDILDNLIQLRHKLARLLGYSNYSDFVVEPRMAKKSAKVFEFLEDISANLTDLAMRELNMLKDLKSKEEGILPLVWKIYCIT
ncbi:putative thimet oligopeptidase [Iris pallida]|uniref:Thimet oligopeptidase n=1 Tax=Iris pallida TaxID=29817 RepID=A0AAX6EYZ9_IRIPA|nr:putative thimet oligopeptidase [Iris pallida]